MLFDEAAKMLIILHTGLIVLKSSLCIDPSDFSNYCTDTVLCLRIVLRLLTVIYFSLVVIKVR
jgi:hypothetical protein